MRAEGALIVRMHAAVLLALTAFVAGIRLGLERGEIRWIEPALPR